MSTTVEERYDPDRIDAIRRYLQRESDKGRPKDYEIRIDKMRVVGRTDDVAEFEDYDLSFNRDKVHTLSILIYEGKSNHHTDHLFVLNAPDNIPAVPTNGLGSLGEVNELIQHRIDENNKQHQIDALKEKLEVKETELRDVQEHLHLLEQENEALKAKRYKLPNGQDIPELLGRVLQGVLINKAGSPLAGLLGPVNGTEPPAAEPPQPKPEEDRATFKEKEEQQEPSPVARAIAAMQTAFSSEQLHTVNQILNCFMKRPEQIPVVAELLDIKIKNV